MYSILLVDDEMPAIKTAEIIINSLNIDFKIIATAQDGKEAFEKYSALKPDLIITDIQMPVMDGLKLIRQIRATDKNQKFVILSCHENFNYAREAFKMGVSEYLIKDMITPQDVLGVLTRMGDGLSDKNTSQEQQAFFNNEFKAEFKNIALKSILFENISEDRKKEYIEKFELNLRGKYYVIMCIVIDDYRLLFGDLNYQDKKFKIDIIYGYICDILKHIGNGECLYNSNGQFVIITCIDNITSELRFINQCYDIVNQINRKMRETMSYSIFTGISKGFSLLTQTNEKYEEANNVTKYKMFLGKGKTIFSNNLVLRSINFDPAEIDEKINRIIENVIRCEIKSAVQEMNTLYNYDISGFMQYNYVKYINTILISNIYNLCKKYKISYKSVFETDYIPVEILENFETIDDMVQWFCTKFYKIEEIIRKKMDKKYSTRVVEAIKFIEQNYHNGITLGEIADKVEIHKVYLSKIFKNQTGKNVSDFILELRIDKAKKLLLTTNDKIYEISEKVGYNYVQQFSYDFKRVTGKTPLEFKENDIQEKK